MGTEHPASNLSQRESLTDPLWRRYERTLLNRIAYRDRELAELHEDYMQLEADYNVIVRQWRALSIERIHRKHAAND